MKGKTKMIVERHYIGTEDECDVFRKVILNEVTRKLNKEREGISKDVTVNDESITAPENSQIST